MTGELKTAEIGTEELRRLSVKALYALLAAQDVIHMAHCKDNKVAPGKCWKECIEARQILAEARMRGLIR